MIKMGKAPCGRHNNPVTPLGFHYPSKYHGGSRPRLCSIALTGLLLMISTLFAKLELITKLLLNFPFIGVYRYGYLVTLLDVTGQTIEGDADIEVG